MGLTSEELQERKNDPNVRYIANQIVNKNKKKPFVFISYKSDDWKIVLRDVVYRLVKEYGLRVYFDGDFDTHNFLWVNQFPENMNSPYCKGVIAFISNQYTRSYATLMELMHSQTYDGATGSKSENGLPVVPVNLEKLNVDKNNYINTGLGRKTYDDGSINNNADAEKERFDEDFHELLDRNILHEAKHRYKYKDLLDDKCFSIFREMIASLKVNENYIGAGDDLDAIVETIRHACGEEVFCNKPVSLEPDGPDIGGSPSSEDGPDQTGVKNGEKESLKENDPEDDGYHYRIYDTEYHAGRREQAKIMYDAFWALTDKYPGKAADIAERCKSVARKSDVQSPGTPDSKPPYFRMCKEYNILGIDYVVGSSYGFDAKIAEIYKMFDACSEDREAFKLDEYKQSVKKSKTVSGKEQDERESSAGKYIYELWGETYTAGKLSDLMHDVFDLIAGKYADRMPAIAQNDSITAVAFKEAVDNKTVPAPKINYFKAKKEHNVNGGLYYMSTYYNREHGIRQLQKMLEICEGGSDSLKIISYPQKSSHGSKKQV